MLSRIYHVFILPCCLMMLSGCAPNHIIQDKPVLTNPELRETAFISFDGTELPLRVWQPQGNAGCIFIAVHGFNDYSNFIRRGAGYFNRSGITVYAYDQRGFGRAPLRGRWSSARTMAQDLKTLIRLVTAKHQDLPVYILGHSMGGAVIIEAMAGENPGSLAGAILVAPAVWARATMPFYQNWALWLAAHTLPWFTVTGESLDRKPSDNMAMLREQGNDPLVIKETRFDVIYGLQDLMDAAYRAADTYSLRTLVLYGRHDEIIPAEPVIEVFRRFPVETGDLKKLILYENGYHMLLRDLQAENVMADIVSWVNPET